MKNIFKRNRKTAADLQYKVTVRNLMNDEIETTITDRAGLTGIILAGYDIIETEEVSCG